MARKPPRNSFILTTRLDQRSVARVKRGMQRRYKTLDEALEQLAADYAQRMEIAAKLRVPWRTGALSRSIQASVRRIVTRWVVDLRANADGTAPYWAHVEWGTVNMDAQPYLRPVIDEFRPQWIRDCATLRKLYTGR